MSLIKLNNRAVKDVTEFGSISSLGSLVHISTATASASASIEFTSGIDSTYKEYVFYFVNIHPATDDIIFTFQGSTDGGSNYNTTATTTFFRAGHNEADSDSFVRYETGHDEAQTTGFIDIDASIGNDNDQHTSGFLHLYNPSNTTFVKHFIASNQSVSSSDYSVNTYMAGYFNTTSAIDAIKFQMSSGNIDAGQILLFGVN
jgi:hypothetical protein